jgi:hypothetical protein
VPSVRTSLRSVKRGWGLYALRGFCYTPTPAGYTSAGIRTLCLSVAWGTRVRARGPFAPEDYGRGIERRLRVTLITPDR